MDIFWLANMFYSMGPLATTFLLGFIPFLFMLWQSLRKQTYWKKLRVPYVKPYPFFGSLLDMIRKPMHDVEMDRYNKYGTIYGHYEGNRPILSVAEPEILRKILVKDFQFFKRRRAFNTRDKILQNMLFNLNGEDWKRVRTIVSPTFSTGKIRRMFGILKDCSQALVKNFQELSKKNEPVEIKSIYGTFTMDVIASCAFSTKIDSHNDPDNDFVKTAKRILNMSSWRFILLALFPGVMKFFRIRLLHPNSIKFFMDASVQIMEERKRTGQTRNDYLQLLMDTAKEVSEVDKLNIHEKDDDLVVNYGKEENDIVFNNVISKKSLSSNELVAQCVLFFLVGYDSTASTLSFATYLLALNPDIQEKLISEVDDIIKEKNGELTYEAIQSMKYLDNVISETLRLYAIAIRLEREAEEDYQLADTGITIPKGMLISIPAYAMHRDPKLFTDPERFDPDRWLPEERAKRDQFTFLPFGAGPRNCVAMRFALMEAKVCLVHVLRNFRVKKCSKTKVPLDFKITQGLQPKEITVLFEIRKDVVEAL